MELVLVNMMTDLFVEVLKMSRWGITITSISLLCTSAFAVIICIDLQAGFSGKNPVLDINEFRTLGWIAIAISLLGPLICIKDITVRFDTKDERIKWYLLFFFVATIAYPYYFFVYAIKSREKK